MADLADLAGMADLAELAGMADLADLAVLAELAQPILSITSVKPQFRATMPDLPLAQKSTSSVNPLSLAITDRFPFATVGFSHAIADLAHNND